MDILGGVQRLERKADILGGVGRVETQAGTVNGVRRVGAQMNTIKGARRMWQIDMVAVGARRRLTRIDHGQNDGNTGGPAAANTSGLVIRIGGLLT